MLYFTDFCLVPFSDDMPYLEILPLNLSQKITDSWFCLLTVWNRAATFTNFNGLSVLQLNAQRPSFGYTDPFAAAGNFILRRSTSRSDFQTGLLLHVSSTGKAESAEQNRGGEPQGLRRTVDEEYRDSLV
mmetsp:Transcript_59396/g.105966  ORF Transcript_59396/g.105966 Transcript_59396/m.105966 type:complete len:130 (-) Transcript_59396:46-435(-)